jgi:hypothetical protein
MKGFMMPFGILVIVFIISFICTGSVQAASRPLQVEVRGSLLEIQADGVPLRDVLADVSAKSGLVVKATAPITETVTCSFTGLTIEEGVKKLLKDWDYALIFSKTKDAMFSPTKLWILGKGDLISTLTPIDSSLITDSAFPLEGRIYPDGRTNVHRKDWLAKEVQDLGKLSSQFSTMPSGNRTEEKGIVITRLASGSVLQKIGLSQGDVVSRVNGRPTETTEEFISALQSVPQETSATMMIERRKPDGRIDPVYVHLD